MFLTKMIKGINGIEYQDDINRLRESLEFAIIQNLHNGIGSKEIQMLLAPLHCLVLVERQKIRITHQHPTLLELCSNINVVASVLQYVFKEKSRVKRVMFELSREHLGDAMNILTLFYRKYFSEKRNLINMLITSDNEPFKSLFGEIAKHSNLLGICKTLKVSLPSIGNHDWSKGMMLNCNGTISSPTRTSNKY